MEKYISKASKAHADVIVFPEGFMFYYGMNDSLKERSEKSEPVDGPFVKEVSKQARNYGINVVFGMNEKVTNELRTYNTTLTIGRSGEVIDIYRKTHLYDAFNMKESEKNIPSNNELKVYDVEGFKIGTIVCYEVRFPEMARTLALKGVEILIVPSAWVKGYNKEDNWLSVIKTRAMENTIYVGTSNQIGNIYTGISSFVDPLGIILSRANEQEGMIFGTASKERLSYAMDLLPLIHQRNTEVYDL